MSAIDSDKQPLDFILAHSTTHWRDDLVAAARSELRALVAERDALKQQAEIHAMEARVQRATVQEIYQLCTGATGEPGDWNGAEPVRRLVAERDGLRAALDNARIDIHSEDECAFLVWERNACDCGMVEHNAAIDLALAPGEQNGEGK